MTDPRDAPITEPLDAPKAKPRRLRLFAGLTLALSTIVCVGLFEVTLRAARGHLLGRPAAASSINMLSGVYPGIYDAMLGYVPRSGISDHAIWKTTVSITEEGVRSNGRPPLAPVIVAVGDSYTFGDEVGDAETWPARLEERLGQGVVNGGVFGYGFDQTVLRAEQLVEQHGPQVLVVSVIPDDIRRCEYAYRYAWKPYFEVAGDGLVLRNVPVPQPHVGPPDESWWRRGLRVSFAADFVMRRLDPKDWPLPDSLRIHRQGAAVSRLLVDRLASAAEASGHQLLVVVQWHPYAEMDLVEPLMDQARRRGVAVLSLKPTLRREIKRLGSPDSFFRLDREDGRVVRVKHMTPAGNAWVAEAVAAELSQAR